MLYCTALYCQVRLLEESWRELFLLCSVQWSQSLCPYALLYCSVLSGTAAGGELVWAVSAVFCTVEPAPLPLFFTVQLCTVRYCCWRRAGVSCSCCALYSGACPLPLCFTVLLFTVRYCCWRRAGVSCSCCVLYSGACPPALMLYFTALYCQVLLLEESWCELFLLCSVQWCLPSCPNALMYSSVLSGTAAGGELVWAVPAVFCTVVLAPLPLCFSVLLCTVRYCCWRRAGVSCSCCVLYSGACLPALMLYFTALYCQVLLLEESWCELFLLCSVQWCPAPLPLYFTVLFCTVRYCCWRRAGVSCSCCVLYSGACHSPPPPPCFLPGSCRSSPPPSPTHSTISTLFYTDSGTTHSQPDQYAKEEWTYE